MGPTPAVAACRSAVRAALDDLAGTTPPPLVLVAVSGGADSLALLQAACFVGPRTGVRVGAVTVDHGLQEGSVGRARVVAAGCVALGADPVSIWHVRVGDQGGPEGAARTARHDALQAAANAEQAAAVLLAHSLDDQAETVLLGLARGSGARSLAGMSVRSGLLRRPLLRLPRTTLADAARDGGGPQPWEDPHNRDPRFARARVRHRVLPVLEAELGPGVAAALARTADLLRADADALDEWARRAVPDPSPRMPVAALRELPGAVRTRVLRRAALEVGAPPSDLTAGHVAALDRLATAAAPGSAVDLPGGVRATREGRLLTLTRRR